MNQPVLEFKNVTWTYEDMDHPALRDVSFTVDRGELVGIVGVNDAGKSTLCRLCNGLIPNSFIGQLTGDVLVNGQSIRDMETAALARSVGSVFSDPEAQMSQVTVLDELYFGPANLNRPKEEILAAAQSVMELLDLAKFRDRSPFQLSGGEQQRVAIASVLTMQPEILALDEPTSNLDPISTERIFQVIAQLNREMGRIRSTISAVGPIWATISSMLLYAIGDLSSVSGTVSMPQPISTPTMPGTILSRIVMVVPIVQPLPA